MTLPSSCGGRAPTACAWRCTKVGAEPPGHCTEALAVLAGTQCRPSSWRQPRFVRPECQMRRTQLFWLCWASSCDCGLQTPEHLRNLKG